MTVSGDNVIAMPTGMLMDELRRLRANQAIDEPESARSLAELKNRVRAVEAAMAIQANARTERVKEVEDELRRRGKILL